MLGSTSTRSERGRGESAAGRPASASAGATPSARLRPIRVSPGRSRPGPPGNDGQAGSYGTVQRRGCRRPRPQASVPPERARRWQPRNGKPGEDSRRPSAPRDRSLIGGRWCPRLTEARPRGLREFDEPGPGGAAWGRFPVPSRGREHRPGEWGSRQGRSRNQRRQASRARTASHAIGPHDPESHAATGAWHSHRFHRPWSLRMYRLNGCVARVPISLPSRPPVRKRPRPPGVS